MIYKVGMLCKHFKGQKLADKNIYKIIALGVDGDSLDTNQVTYTGDGDLVTAKNLVVYANIFQNNKLFAREYEDISSELAPEKQQNFSQTLKVQPLNQQEIAMVSSPDFAKLKARQIKDKF